MTCAIALRKCIYLCLACLFIPALAPAAEFFQAREPIALKVLPEHVGVFYELKTQQFQAIATFADGTEEDYTDKVGWSIEAYPFTNQTMTPDQVATIDRKGLATVLSTWGRVNVKATYPPPNYFSPYAISILLLQPPEPGPEPEPLFRALPGIISLLLSNHRRPAVVTGYGMPVSDNVLGTATGKYVEKSGNHIPKISSGSITFTRESSSTEGADQSVSDMQMLPFARSSSSFD